MRTHTDTLSKDGPRVLMRKALESFRLILGRYVNEPVGRRSTRVSADFPCHSVGLFKGLADAGANSRNMI